MQWPIEESRPVTAKPKRTDYQILIDAFLKASAIFSDYVDDGKASDALDRLMSALISDEVIAAISRIEGRKRFGLIEGMRPRIHDDAG